MVPHSSTSLVQILLTSTTIENFKSLKLNDTSIFTTSEMCAPIVLVLSLIY